MEITKAFPNPKLEVEGVWVDYKDGSRVRIARLGNPEYRRKYERLMKPYRDMERRGTLPNHKQIEVTCRAMAGTILLDWEGFTAQGSPLPYSEDAAAALLQEIMDFRNDIIALADEAETFKNKVTAESEGN